MDDIRRQRTELENHLIDELISGRLTRREFVRRGTVMGMSIPLLGAIVAACGGANSTGGSSAASGGSSGSASVKPGGTVRAAIVVPTGAINPVTVGDQGGLCMLGQVGEFLCVANPNTLELEPVLADSWTANSDSSEWTFKLKSGVTFHDGSPLVADDVVYTMDLLSDSKGTSQALSVFRGVLDKGGTTAVDDQHGQVHPRGAQRQLPVSRLARQLQRHHHQGGHATPRTSRRRSRAPARSSSTSTPPRWAPRSSATTTTGARRPTRTASSSRSTTTKARRSSPSRASRSTSSARSPSPAAGRSSTTRSYVILDIPSTAHRQVHMRNDKEPFTDKRVRQAIALSLDRPAIIQQLFEGKAKVGNDSPFASVFPSTDPSVPQRDAEHRPGQAAALGRRALEPVASR